MNQQYLSIMNTKSLIIALLLIVSSKLWAVDNDTIKNTKKGWSFGAVPVVAFDSDIGFKYGGLVNFYHYGDGSLYPDYKHSIYLEWSRTTKGGGINQITYDSKYLIPGIRVSGEVSYLTEQALDYYGFNGYKTLYDSRFEDKDDMLYQSRLFYRVDRKMLRLRADFQGQFLIENLSWIAGLLHYTVKLDTVDLKKLNKGKSDDDILPPVHGGLFGLYRNYNVIPSEEFDGGSSTLLKLGVNYDTRDNEPNPMYGVWTNLLVLVDPGFLGESKAYGKYIFTHRQYFTILPDHLSFAYRVAYQGKLFGTTPSYMLPIIFNNGRYIDRDGLGGAKTMRGVLRDRVVGEDVAYGNFEFRWKFIRTVIKKQNIYLALSAFTDLGMVTREYNINKTQIAQEFPEYFPTEKEKLHQSLGAGFRFALNENFIVAVDYGIALDKRDGDSGLYINMDWLF
jgi:outer membrane protein assembly factor BamA